MPERSAIHRLCVGQGRSPLSADTASNQAPNHVKARNAHPRMLGPGHPPDGAWPKTGRLRYDASQSGAYTVPASTAATDSGSRPARLTRMPCAAVSASATRIRICRLRRLTPKLSGGLAAAKRRPVRAERSEAVLNVLLDMVVNNLQLKVRMQPCFLVIQRHEPNLVETSVTMNCQAKQERDDFDEAKPQNAQSDVR